MNSWQTFQCLLDYDCESYVCIICFKGPNGYTHTVLMCLYVDRLEIWECGLSTYRQRRTFWVYQVESDNSDYLGVIHTVYANKLWKSLISPPFLHNHRHIGPDSPCPVCIRSFTLTSFTVIFQCTR